MMELSLISFLLFSLLFKIRCNYVLIPFDSMIYNPKNEIFIQKDAVTSKFLEDIYFNLTIGNPKQIIPIFIRLDKYELKIKEPNYISSSSKTFQNYLIKNKILCKDNLYFMSLNSMEDVNNFIYGDTTYKNKKEKEMIKEYENITFVYLNNSTPKLYLEYEMLDYEYNKIFKYNYGMLGLRKVNIKLNNNPQFVDGLKETKEINKAIFSFIFNKDKNSHHLGYLIIGDKYIDKKTEYEQLNITNFALRREVISWDLIAETIYSQSYKEKVNSLYERNINVELRVELSYIFGSKYYRAFIDKEFFNDLVEQKICQYREVKTDLSYGTYVCDGKSEIFKDYYKNKFPDLVFTLKNIEDKFILTKEDLFFKNPNDKSDTNVYFRIYFHVVISTTWALGRTFLQKYRFSFDDDASLIYYHKSKNINNINKNTIIDNKSKSNIIKIILISLFGLVTFILGFLFHKSLIKLPRKIKANELEDEYSYQNENKKEKLNKDFDINNDNMNKSNKNRLYMELGSQ